MTRVCASELCEALPLLELTIKLCEHSQQHHQHLSVPSQPVHPQTKMACGGTPIDILTSNILPKQNIKLLGTTVKQIILLLLLKI